MDLTKGEIIIMSGEGTGEGTIERYEGARTVPALRKRLSRERAGGARWADAWIELPGVQDQVMALGGMPHAVYGKLGRDLVEIVDQRAIAPDSIRSNPAAMLAAGHKRPASRANGAKGGRPRKA